MTNPVTQKFIPGPRLIDGTDLNNLVDQTNAGFTGGGAAGSFSSLAVSGNSALNTTQVSGLTSTSVATLASLAVTGNSALHTTQVSGLTSTALISGTTLAMTGNASLATTQVGGLLTTQALTVGVAGVNSATYVANGTTPTTVQLSGITSTSLALFSLRTVGGTVGAIPTVKSVSVGNFLVAAATASDTSTYNVLIIN